MFIYVVTFILLWLFRLPWPQDVALRVWLGIGMAALTAAGVPCLFYTRNEATQKFFFVTCGILLLAIAMVIIYSFQRALNAKHKTSGAGRTRQPSERTPFWAAFFGRDRNESALGYSLTSRVLTLALFLLVNLAGFGLLMKLQRPLRHVALYNSWKYDGWPIPVRPPPPPAVSGEQTKFAEITADGISHGQFLKCDTLEVQVVAYARSDEEQRLQAEAANALLVESVELAKRHPRFLRAWHWQVVAAKFWHDSWAHTGDVDHQFFVDHLDAVYANVQRLARVNDSLDHYFDRRVRTTGTSPQDRGAKIKRTATRVPSDTIFSSPYPPHSFTIRSSDTMAR